MSKLRRVSKNIYKVTIDKEICQVGFYVLAENISEAFENAKKYRHFDDGVKIELFAMQVVFEDEENKDISIWQSS